MAAVLAGALAIAGCGAIGDVPDRDAMPPAGQGPLHVTETWRDDIARAEAGTWASVVAVAVDQGAWAAAACDVLAETCASHASLARTAVADCEARSRTGAPCYLYAIDRRVVWVRDAPPREGEELYAQAVRDRMARAVAGDVTGTEPIAAPRTRKIAFRLDWAGQFEDARGVLTLALVQTVSNGGVKYRSRAQMVRPMRARDCEITMTLERFAMRCADGAVASGARARDRDSMVFHGLDSRGRLVEIRLLSLGGFGDADLASRRGGLAPA